jgi:glycosyltransferase involved in cell wall biosynthesis
VTQIRLTLPLSLPDHPSITRSSRVLTIIPHYRCEEWLEDCLASITEQTRPPQGIVVVDDASGEPPRRVVRRFGSVTLMTTDRNVGPYGIVQQVMSDTDYDAYMFQDADDWSAPERLAFLLDEAERTGAELIGSHYCMVCCNELHCRVRYFPRDVNDALVRFPTWHALQHPTSLVSRALVERLGGFASGMRFSGEGFAGAIEAVGIAGLSGDGIESIYYRGLEGGDADMRRLQPLPLHRLDVPVFAGGHQPDPDRPNRGRDLQPPPVPWAGIPRERHPGRADSC